MASDKRPTQPISTAVPPSQFLRDGEVRTSIGADAVIHGKLSFTTPTRIEGRLKGEVRCTHLLVIGPTAIVEGWVKAEDLRIEGTLRGEIMDSGRVEIRESGSVVGKVFAQRLIVREGALLQAECRVGVAAGRTLGVASPSAAKG